MFYRLFLAPYISSSANIAQTKYWYFLATSVNQADRRTEALIQWKYNIHLIIRIVRGELSYLAPLGSENISVLYFKQCFLRGVGGITPRLNQTPRLPVPRQK